MAVRASEMTNDEIRALMHAIAIANGRPLSNERVEEDLPAYRNFLLAMERIDQYPFKVEDEPAFHFSLDPSKAGPR